MAQKTEYGGFWVRVVALTLDNAIVLLIMLAVGIAMVTVKSVVGIELPDIVVSLPFTLIPLFYWPVLESSHWQATVGKRIMGLQVTNLDGDRLSFLVAFLRSLAKIISAIPLGIGYLFAAFTARKQALHDLIVKTLVVRTGPSHLWKIILALIVGLVIMVASAVGFFHYVVTPMFRKGVEGTMQQAMKSAPQVKAIPASAPTRKEPAQQMKPDAPAPASKAGPDPDFDAIVGKPLAGPEKPNTTRAGPAILELSTVFPGTLWVKIYLPVPALNDPTLLPGPLVMVDRVLDSGGADYFDAVSTFEKDDFFRRPSLSAAKDPVPHLAGLRTVHLKPGLREQALQKVEGQVTFMVPADPGSVIFGAKETGKEKPVHDAFVALKSVSGNTATLHFRGASENLLRVRGVGADGKSLAQDTRQILPENSDVDNDFTISFKGAPAKIEVTVAARIIRRYFPFSLARGAVAGPPTDATQGYTLPPRPRAAQPAAAAPAAAPAKPEAKPEAMKVAPKPELKPAPKPATKKAEPAPTPKPEAKAKMVEPKPEPKAAPAPAKMEKEAVPQIETRPPAPASGATRRSRANEDARECLKLSTDSEIRRCAEKFR